MIFKTCRPKLPEKKVQWHVGSWKPPTHRHKKEKMVILLPHENNLQTFIVLSALRALSTPLSDENLSLLEPHRSHSHHHSEMTTIITTALRNWLIEHDL